MTTVLVCDDQAMIRSALAALLDLEDDLTVVAQAGSCGEAIAFARRFSPDVVLIDVQMPAGGGADDGIDAAARIVADSPNSQVIVLTTFGRPGYLRRAMEAGAIGFMVKDAPADRLIDGVRQVASGHRVVDPELAAASLSVGHSPLSPRESAVLAAAAKGGTSADVAARVFLTEGTVRNHLSSAIGKLGATNRAEAIRIATDNGWL